MNNQTNDFETIPDRLNQDARPQSEKASSEAEGAKDVQSLNAKIPTQSSNATAAGGGSGTSQTEDRAAQTNEER